MGKDVSISSAKRRLMYRSTAMARWSCSGRIRRASPIRAFGSNGYAYGGTGVPQGLGFQSDDKIVVAGRDGGATGLSRFTEDGSPDIFGLGLVDYQTDRVCGLGVDAQNRSTVVGVTQNQDGTSIHMFAARLAVDGVLDPTFGNGIIDVAPNGTDGCQLTAVEPDGTVLVPARAATAGGPATVTVIAPDASRETVYSVAGGTYPTFLQAAANPSGAIVAVGTADAATDSAMIVARLLPP